MSNSPKSAGAVPAQSSQDAGTKRSGSPAGAQRTRNTRSADLELEATETKDSRGRPTVMVVAKLNGRTAKGDVPAGASKGEDEAQTVDVATAIKNVHEIILPILREADIDIRKHDNLLKLEQMLIDRAGDNYCSLGANAVLPVSRALWALAAALRDMSLCKYIRKYEPSLAGTSRVQFFMNIFNGGLHALRDGETLGKDRIDIQEIMVVPVGATNYRDALMMGDRIDATLKDLLVSRYKADAVTRADEAGFSVRGLGDSARAIAHVFEAIERAGYMPGSEVKLALDVAASSFYNKDTKKYDFGGEALGSKQMSDYLVALVDKYPGKILSIEDGLDENDWEAWSLLSTAMGQRDVLTIGDDLFVTQTRRLRRGINNSSAHAILVKVNQNGSVAGTLEVMKYARQNGMKCVISHRSGETLDDSIADLAMATGALGLKTGDPQPEEDFPDRSTWVRRRKYLRMIDLEEIG